jgi:hypothetical protein
MRIEGGYEYPENVEDLLSWGVVDFCDELLDPRSPLPHAWESILRPNFPHDLRPLGIAR